MKKALKRLLCVLGIHSNKYYLTSYFKEGIFKETVVYDQYHCTCCNTDFKRARTSYYSF